jgi:hypothetical protein
VKPGVLTTNPVNVPRQTRGSRIQAPKLKTSSGDVVIAPEVSVDIVEHINQQVETAPAIISDEVLTQITEKQNANITRLISLLLAEQSESDSAQVQSGSTIIEPESIVVDKDVAAWGSEINVDDDSHTNAGSPNSTDVVVQENATKDSIDHDIKNRLVRWADMIKEDEEDFAMADSITKEADIAPSNEDNQIEIQERVQKIMRKRGDIAKRQRRKQRVRLAEKEIVIDQGEELEPADDSFMVKRREAQASRKVNKSKDGKRKDGRDIDKFKKTGNYTDGNVRGEVPHNYGFNGKRDTCGMFPIMAAEGDALRRLAIHHAEAFNAFMELVLRGNFKPIDKSIRCTSLDYVAMEVEKNGGDIIAAYYRYIATALQVKDKAKKCRKHPNGPIPANKQKINPKEKKVLGVMNTADPKASCIETPVGIDNPTPSSIQEVHAEKAKDESSTIAVVQNPRRMKKDKSKEKSPSDGSAAVVSTQLVQKTESKQQTVRDPMNLSRKNSERRSGQDSKRPGPQTNKFVPGNRHPHNDRGRLVDPNGVEPKEMSEPVAVAPKPRKLKQDNSEGVVRGNKSRPAAQPGRAEPVQNTGDSKTNVTREQRGNQEVRQTPQPENVRSQSIQTRGGGGKGKRKDPAVQPSQTELVQPTGIPKTNAGHEHTSTENVRPQGIQARGEGRGRGRGGRGRGRATSSN